MIFFASGAVLRSPGDKASKITDHFLIFLPTRVDKSASISLADEMTAGSHVRFSLIAVTPAFLRQIFSAGFLFKTVLYGDGVLF